MKRYKFLDERKFRYFCQGLTLDSGDMKVLDKVLCSLDEKSGRPSCIVAHNQRHGFGPPPPSSGPQIVVNVDKYYSQQKGHLSTSTVLLDSKYMGSSPAVHINLRSIALDIPQRVEIPMRYVLKGLPKIDGTYMVYLHALRMDDGITFVYYGITRRGWMERFNEHMSSAMKERSPLMFHRTLREGILGRLIQLNGRHAVQISAEAPPEKIMVGNHHVVCVAGLDESQAQDTEEYLVEKYSFGHEEGLNMIPGGKAGLKYLHKLNVLPQDRPVLLDYERDAVLASYLRTHPRKGLPNPLVVERWKDDEYAAQVICGGESRLSIDQVRNIRRFSSLGVGAEEICRKVGASNVSQVKRVLAGKTYGRVH